MLLEVIGESGAVRQQFSVRLRGFLIHIPQITPQVFAMHLPLEVPDDLLVKLVPCSDENHLKRLHSRHLPKSDLNTRTQMTKNDRHSLQGQDKDIQLLIFRIDLARELNFLISS